MDDTIERVHVVFKTHLDVGFTDMPRLVVKRYFEEFIPRSLATARELEDAGGEERFVWTIGSWLIAEYLDKAPAGKASELEEAIRAGRISWHAFPFTPHHELMDAGMFRYELELTKRLDDRFGKRTIAAKLTDVPGDTRAILHHLQEAGVEFLHIGVNKASSLPEVPPICLWRDPEGGEVALMYHSGYGNAMYAPGEMSDRYSRNATHFPGMKDALYFAFTLDNRGPHTPESVRGVFADVRAAFPGARIIASTMDAFAEKLWEVKNRLPVVEGEIGNTWIHGGGADPGKLSRFRALSRLRADWIARGAVSPDDPVLERFSRRLLLVPEHTWGLNESRTLDHANWNPWQLAAVRATPPYRRMEESWAEARAYIDEAVAELGEGPLAAEAKAVLAVAAPRRPQGSGYELLADIGARFEAGEFVVAFDPESGAIVRLEDQRSGRLWADSTHPWGNFRQQSFDEADWARFFGQYIIHDEDWVRKDFGKPGIDAAGAVSAWRTTRLRSLRRNRNGAGTRFLLEMDMPERPPTDYGLPAQVTLELFFPEWSSRSVGAAARTQAPASGTKAGATIEWNYQWFGKRANRLPEAYWIGFQPMGTKPECWRMEKIDRMISPLDVVPKGGRNLHGINRGVFYADEKESFAIETLDAGIVAPGMPKLLDLDGKLPDLAGGWHFNLWNNKWGCNFPTWYDADARFRFRTVFGNGC